MRGPDPSLSLLENFEAAARRRPDLPALTFLDASLNPKVYTSEALFSRAAEVGARLRERALPPKTPVGVLSASQEVQVLHFLAALHCGLTPAVLTPPSRKLRRDYYMASLAHVLEACHFGALLSDVDGVSAPCPTLAPWSCEGAPAAADEGVLPADGVFLQFSSGTTGHKKGVLVRETAVLAQLSTYGEAIGLDAQDCIVSWLPLYHDMGFVAALNLPLAWGVPVVMLNPLDWVANPALYLQAVSRYRGTLGWHPNFAYAFMADRVPDAKLEGVSLGSLRGLVNCAEPVTRESQERFQRRFSPLGLRPGVFWGCYAMAETTFALTHGTSERHEDILEARPDGPPSSLFGRPAVSVGRALPGVDLVVVDEEGRTLPEGHLGELAVRSPFNAEGYFRNPEATAAAFRAGRYHTGDLGYRRGERYFVCGRKKDLLIIGGVNVYPEDLEQVAGGVEGVHPGRVVAFSSFDAETQTEAATVLAESDRAGGPEQRGVVIEIQQRLLAALQIASFKVHLVPEGSLIKSSSGKIARAASRDWWLARTSPLEGGASGPPRGDAPSRPR
ncbi:MAG: AMP-binding protein [Acidobacteria bacterium]|nr:AMP-binding protein [Acidobacteriota bacterium]